MNEFLSTDQTQTDREELSGWVGHAAVCIKSLRVQVCVDDGTKDVT